MVYPVLATSSDPCVILLDCEAHLSICIANNANGIGLTLPEAQVLHKQLGQIVHAAELLEASEQQTAGKKN